MFCYVFCGFLKGPNIDPLAPAQSKHRFSLPACAVKLLCFSYNFMHIPGTLGIEIGPQNIKHRASKQHPVKSTFFSVPVLFLVAFCPRYGPPHRASGSLWPSKGQGFLESEALDSQKAVPHHAWGPLALQGYRVFSHRGPRPTKKTTI